MVDGFGRRDRFDIDAFKRHCLLHGLDPIGLTLQHEPFKGSVRFPVVFLTGHGDVEMSVKAMKAGAFDFMTKPFKDQDLIDTIAAALKKDCELKRQERIVAGIRQTYDSLTTRERERSSCGCGPAYGVEPGRESSPAGRGR